MIVIFLIRRKKRLSENKSIDNNSTTNMPLDKNQINKSTVKDEYGYEPNVQSINPKVKIIFHLFLSPTL